MDPNHWQTWLDFCNGLNGTPWLPVRRRDHADIAGWWTYPPKACRYEVRVKDIEPVWPEIGAIVGGCPLGLVSEKSLLQAGVPADYVETLRPLIGLDGASALAVLEQNGPKRFALPAGLRGIPGSAWKKNKTAEGDAGSG